MPNAAGKAQKQSGKGRKRRRRRQAKRYVLHYFLLVAFCTAVAAIMCYSVFFKVEQIKVVGNTVYSEQQIIDLTGVELQDNLFQINVSSIAKKMKAKLYYIQSVKVKRRLPTTLLVEIIEEEPMGAIYTPQGYSIVSANGKVLETRVLSPPETIPRVLGMEYGNWEQGDYIKVKTDNSKELTLDPRILLLQSFHKVTKELEITEFDYVNLSDIYNIQAMYDGRLLVSFGGEHKLDVKMIMLKSALDKDLPHMPKEAGEVDVKDATTLRCKESELSKIKDPKAYTEFGTGEDTSQIGQAQSETSEQSVLATGEEPLLIPEQAVSPDSVENVSPGSTETVPNAQSEQTPEQAPAKSVVPPTDNQEDNQQIDQAASKQIINGQPSASPPIANQAPAAASQQSDSTEENSASPLPSEPNEKEKADSAFNTPSRPPIVNKG